MTCSLLIPEAVAKSVCAKLERLARKAGVVVTVVNGTTHLCDRGSAKHPIACARITVGEMPRVNGWELIARLEHTEGGVVVNLAPGEALDPAWRTADPRCSHCGTVRQRANTFILRTPTGDVVQIGRNCLAEYLSTDPSKLVAAAELAAWLAANESGWSEFEPSRGRSADAWTRDYLAYCVRSIERSGFHKSDSDRSTKEAAWYYLRPLPPRSDEDVKRDYLQGQPTEPHYAAADEAMAWARTLADQAGSVSDYEHNLCVCAQNRFVGRNSGLLASLPVAHQRAQGKQAERRSLAQRTTPAAGHFGTVGKRLDFEAVFVGRTDIETNWGSKHICRFVTDAGHALVWFATSAAPMAEGTRLKLRATIKEHGEYHGRPQTVLSRATWVDLTERPKDLFVAAFQAWLWETAPGPYADDARRAIKIAGSLSDARALFMARGKLEVAS